jgi:hypothetical protein
LPEVIFLLGYFESNHGNTLGHPENKGRSDSDGSNLLPLNYSFADVNLS